MRDEFERVGAAHVRGAVPVETCARLCDAIDESRERPSQHYGVLSLPGQPVFDSDLFRWFDVPAISEAMFRSPLAALAADLLGTDGVVFVEDQWFAAAPGAATPSPWHQDGPYYNIDGDFVTLWLALDDAPAGAALAVIPGSHRWGRTFAPVEFVPGGRTIDGAGLERLADDTLASASALSWDVHVGDVVALHPLTLHSAGSEPVADGWFRRFSTRWAAPDARYVDRGDQAADFWRLLPHGLATGDLLACATFPLVGTARARSAAPP